MGLFSSREVDLTRQNQRQENERIRLHNEERQRNQRIQQAELERQRNQQTEIERQRIQEAQRLRVLRQREQEQQTRRNIQIEYDRLQRIQQEERERQRIQDQNEQDERDAEKNLADAIDLYIRTRRLFNSINPLSYKCGISSILQDESVNECLANLNSYYIITINEFVSIHDRFVVRGAQISVKYLTPFQGEVTHRVFGEFKCGNTNCGRTWSSAFTWKNKWQKCKGCESKCYPFKQHVLERSNNDTSDNRRPHDMERCQKCIELGELCVPSMFYDSRSGLH